MKVSLFCVINRGTRTFKNKEGREIIITSLVVKTDEGKVYDCILFGADSVGVKDGSKITVEMTSFGRSQRSRQIEISGHIVK